MKTLLAALMLASGVGFAQDLPQTYAPIMIHFAGAVQFDCQEHIDVPHRSACYRLPNSPDLARLQFDAYADDVSVTWRGSWQEQHTGATQRWFGWNGEPHAAWVNGREFQSVLVLLPGAGILESDE